VTGNATIDFNTVEQFNPSLDWEQLLQEVGSLRAIVVELLIKNQKLRWELGHGSELAHDPRLFMASEETPLRRNSRTATMP
jgi:regulator of replication initiation timing